jgi:hypothetical protein
LASWRIGPKKIQETIPQKPMPGNPCREKKQAGGANPAGLRNICGR